MPSPNDTTLPKGPLSGLRVLDTATFIAAPFSAATLAEFGAEVIKVEQPRTGDPMRSFGSRTDRGDTLNWLNEGRNKRSVTLNLKSPEGAAIFRKLAATADVLCENFRPGTLEGWGIGPDALWEINPGLIILQVSGFGQDGPYRNFPGFARIAHAVGGLSYLAGEPGGRPVVPGSTSLADYISGLYGVIGILLALRHRDQTGQGQTVDVALYESIFRVLDEIAPAHAMFGTVREPMGSAAPNVCPHSHYRTGDGKWVAIACTSDKMFERLAKAMGRPELAAPNHWGKVGARIGAASEVDRAVESWTMSMTLEEVLERTRAGDVPAGPLNTIADIFTDPQFVARGVLETHEAEGVGPVTVPGPLPRLSRSPGRIRNLGPRLGADNEAILGGELGLDAGSLKSLSEKGII